MTEAMRRRLSDRRRLPNRRAAIAFDFSHRDLKYRAHVGFFQDGKPAELFLDSSKPNSTIDAFASDAAILISLLLQRGSSFAEIGHALRRTPNGEAASLIGAAIDELSKLPDADGEATPGPPLLPSGPTPSAGAVNQITTLEPVP